MVKVSVALSAMFSVFVVVTTLSPAQAEMASIYGGGDGFNCAATAAHRTLPFGTHLIVCHEGCVTV